MNPREPLSAEEQALATHLRAPAGSGPSPAVDAHILAMARNAVAASGTIPNAPPAPLREHAQYGRRTRRVVAPIALAASLVLAVGVAWQQRLDPSIAASNAVLSSDAAVAPATTAVTPTAPETTPQPASVPNVATRHAPAPAPAAPTALPAESPLATRSPSSDSARRVVHSATSAAAEPAAPAQHDASETVAVSGSKVAARVAGAPVTSGPQKRVVIHDAVAPPTPPAPPAPAAAPASARIATVAPTNDDAPMALHPRISEVSSNGASAGSHVVDVTVEAARPAVDADARLSKRRWLKKIRQRLREGDIATARASLQRFIVTHPNAAIPEELQPLLQP